MENIKVNQRVNVSIIIKQDWQSEHWLNNAIATEVTEKHIKVRTDNNTTHNNFCSFPFGGTFYLSAYNVTSCV